MIDKFGVESTGSYAAAITRFLLEAGIDMVEVDQPHPHPRALRGKDHKSDAEAAARKALSGQAGRCSEDHHGSRRVDPCAASGA